MQKNNPARFFYVKMLTMKHLPIFRSPVFYFCELNYLPWHLGLDYWGNVQISYLDFIGMGSIPLDWASTVLDFAEINFPVLGIGRLQELLSKIPDFCHLSEIFCGIFPAFCENNIYGFLKPFPPRAKFYWQPQEYQNTMKIPCPIVLKVLWY